MNELTAKQKTFIEELPKSQWNGTKAAVAAGYSPKSAAVMAHRLLKNPKIAAELEKRRVQIVEKTDVEVGEIVAGLRVIAFGERATNSDRLRALDLPGRYKAMFTDRQVFVDEGEQRILDERERQECLAIAAIRLGMGSGGGEDAAVKMIAGESSDETALHPPRGRGSCDT